jgi:hypothetical protein
MRKAGFPRQLYQKAADIGLLGLGEEYGRVAAIKCGGVPMAIGAGCSNAMVSSGRWPPSGKPGWSKTWLRAFAIDLFRPCEERSDEAI